MLLAVGAIILCIMDYWTEDGEVGSRQNIPRTEKARKREKMMTMRGTQNSLHDEINSVTHSTSLHHRHHECSSRPSP